MAKVKEYDGVQEGRRKDGKKTSLTGPVLASKTNTITCIPNWQWGVEGSSIW